jgi:hypothetical protein
MAGSARAQWNGFAGDAVLGGSFSHPRYLVPGDPIERLARALSRSMPASGLGTVLNRETAGLLRDHPRAAIRAAFELTSAAGGDAERVRRFLLAERVGRLAAAGLALDRHHLPTLTPFATAPVLALMHELTPAERRFGRALGCALARHHPSLARIPWQRTGAPPGTPWPIAYLARSVWRAGSRVRLMRGPEPFDYGSWFEGPLRGLVNEILTGGGLASLGCFDGAALGEVASGSIRSTRRTALVGVLLSLGIAADIVRGARTPELDLPAIVH